MKAGKFVFTTMLLISATIWLIGCSDDNPVSPSESLLPNIVSVSPPDGADGVAASASITIQFDMPMNPESVMANFHFSGSDEMHDWMDSLEHLHGSGGGHMMDMDDMMEWMHDIEMPGEYHWNDDHDVCEFVPDDGLMPGTEYMVFMSKGMKSHNGGTMSTRHLTYDGYMYHFRTAP